MMVHAAMTGDRIGSPQRQQLRPGENYGANRGVALSCRIARRPRKGLGAREPGSVFCAKSGGKSEIRKGPHGQYGVCRLPDGRVVDEWAYFRAMRGRSR